MRLREFIRRHSPDCPPCDRLSLAESETQFNTLALDLFALQYHAIPAYRALADSRGVNPDRARRWQDIPAVPTTGFKELELSSLPLKDRMAVFHSSGTTGQQHSRHFHSAESLAVYEASLKPWFQANLLGDLDDLVEDGRMGPLDKPGILSLTPPPADAPNSSLVHMMGTVISAFGSRDSLFAGRIGTDGVWELDIDRLLFALRKSMCANRPLWLLGTAFNFVHLADHFIENSMRYRLAEGSRVMETGGYKGRSRSMPKGELHALITKHFGIPAPRIVTEYGMSELSSQAYESGGVLRFPPWARVRIINPETGADATEGGTGIVRIFDLANVWSVASIETGDLGIRRGDGFELIGRVAVAEPRGCSLMAA